MKKYLLATIVLFTITAAQAQITFQKTYGTPKIDYGNSVLQSSDGGYIIAGIIDIGSGGVHDFSLIKTNQYGDTIWTKRYGGYFWDEAYSVAQTSDGGYILVGSTDGFGAGQHDIYIVKTDSLGSLQWSKTYGGTNEEYGYYGQQTSDGGYIICGFGGIISMYIIKTDMLGNIVWSNTYNGTYDSGGRCIIETSDGGYAATGFTTASTGDGDILLLKMDSNGNTVWCKSYGGTGFDMGSFIQQTSDGGYIITGQTESFGQGADDIYLIKTNSNGNLLWSKVYGDTYYDKGYSVKQTNEGGYIICGSTYPNYTNTSALLIKTNGSGNKVWSKSYGGSTSTSSASSVQQTTDGGYIVAGTDSLYNIYLIKTDIDGNSGCNQSISNIIETSPITNTNNITLQKTSTLTIGNPATQEKKGLTVNTLCASSDISEISSNTSIYLYPNPTNGRINIQIPKQFEKTKTLEVYDCLGQLLLTKTDNFSDIDISSLSNGLYFLVLTNVEKKRQLIKIIKD